MLTQSSSFFSSSEHPRTENHLLCKAKIRPMCETTFDAAFDQQRSPNLSSLLKEIRGLQSNMSLEEE